jgi:hypothetical protein
MRLGGPQREERPAGSKVEREWGEGRRGLGIFFLNSFQIHFQTLQTSLKQQKHTFES